MELKQAIPGAESGTHGLLIVPYGIETKLDRFLLGLKELLIVPYGIETSYTCRWPGRLSPFNRTLWN